MKNKMIIILIIALVVFIVSCKNSPTDKSNSESSALTENFDWLLGRWHRINEKDGMETYEIWNKINNTKYVAIGFTLQNSDTIWKENIKLIKSDEDWNFEVIGKGESNPTIFKLTEIDKESFTCENEMNEFPKKIKYFKNENNITAVISGGEMKIPFEFERLNTN
ncbi:MAG: hypothetical protein GQ564_16945 [Bacteroidales bacterium]|nr:hypothetical protein [Bacteroidales bacterium]